MLARTFLPAANLKITDQQRSALIKTLFFFEGGEVKHRPIRRPKVDGEPVGFNMQDWDCGTSCCIGGWADTFGAGFYTPGNTAIFSDALDDLFFPNHGVFDTKLARGLDMWRITVEQAARALRNYLERGEPDWPAVLGPRYIAR